MSNFNFNQANEKLVSLNETIANSQTSKNNGIKNCIVNIETKISEYTQSGLATRKARTSAKKAILSGVNGAIDKSLNRAYGIAFTMIFREVSIHTDLLTVAQIENLANYGTVDKVNELFEMNKSVYSSEVSNYLKSLKTRIVETKTFEKKSNQR